MRDINEVLALQDINQKIYYLKQARRTELPDAARLFADWNPDLHEIMTDKEKYPKIKITLEKGRDEWDDAQGKTVSIPPKTKEVEPNRIALPIEQDIVNIQTAFTVGIEPLLDCHPDDEENALFESLKQTLKRNKARYQNKRAVRSWLAEQEVAEYWYVVDDSDGFWQRLKRRIASMFGASRPQKRLKSALWSPFRGDKLFPFFDDYGNLVAMSREYRRADLDGVETTCFMCITATHVYRWESGASSGGWALKAQFAHGFGKLPVIYMNRPDAYCAKIKTLRVRLEKLMSNYADCIDYHFFPILMLFGDVQKFSGEFKNRIVELTGQGANAQYLTWNQASETVKLELEHLIEMIYSMTGTPRISFENLKGVGNAVSGVAFKYTFMGAHMMVENHAEVVGEFLQRRVNFLVSALGSINSSLEEASKTIDINVQIQPFTIDNMMENIEMAVKAIQGGVWSQQHGIMFVGNADMVNEELQQIKEEQAEKQKTVTGGQNALNQTRVTGD